MTAPPDTSVEATISDLERRWASAFQRKDIRALEDLMADGYALVIAVEDLPLQVVPRNAWLQSLREYEITDAHVDHIHVRVYGNVAVVVMLWHQFARLGGQDRTAQFMLTDIWTNSGNGWRLAERHSSRPEHPGAARPPAEHLADVSS